MAIQNKRSSTPGAVPNLVPGEIAINIADSVLWVRIEGQRTAIPLQGILARAFPSEGATGSILSYDGTNSYWAAARAPSAVVDGVINDELPPSYGLFRCPGSWVTGATVDYGMVPNEVLIENFNVRADRILIDHLTFGIVGLGETQPIRVGIAAADGTIICDALCEAPAPGANVVPVIADLSRGSYKALIWAKAGCTLRLAKALQPEQGWDLSGANLLFSPGARAVADYSMGLHMPPTPTLRTDLAPGVERAVLMAWRLNFAVSPISLAPSTILTGIMVGQPYESGVTAADGVAPYSYAVTFGSLPPGIILNSATGALTGPPQGSGRFGATITATDATGNRRSRSYGVTTIPIPPPPSPPTPSLYISDFTPDQQVYGGGWAFFCVPAGGNPPYSYSWNASGPSVTLQGGFNDGVWIVHFSKSQPGPPEDNSVDCTVTDSLGHTASAGCNVRVF
jgi:hypothetical protein